MTRSTTALLIAGPRSVGPWDDRVWRIALHASLVEGGSAAYWLVTPTLPELHQVVPSEVVLEYPDVMGVVDAVLMMVASHLGGAQVEGLLCDTHNIATDGDVRRIARYWELFADTRSGLVDLLSPYVRLGITVLDDLSLIDSEVVSVLRHLGFDVDVFALSSLSSEVPSE